MRTTAHRTGRRRTALVAVAVLAPVLALAGPADAAPGDLDPGFGAGGVVLGPGGDAQALVRQTDGKLVAAGWVNTQAFAPANVDFRLARYNTNGSLDTTFGTGGVVTTHVTKDDRVYAVAVQGDGKIVAAGTVFSNTTTGNDFALARYNTNGSLDTTFGTGGVVTTPIDGADGTDEVRAVAIQGDGKIVAAGRSKSDFALARYNTNGSLDTGFGTGGKVTTDFAAGADEARAMLVQGDGKIVAAGCTGAVAAPACESFALARYNTDGSLDLLGFGTGGKATGPAGQAYAVALQSDAKIVAAGHNGGNVALARYTTTGSLDTTFGTGGVVSGPAGLARAVALQSDAKVVVAGERSGDFVVARYGAAGSLDTTFGTGGVVVTDLGPTNNASANGLVVQPDGRLVAGGANNAQFALARYEVTGGGESADLAVTMTGAPDPVAVGANLTYTVTVANGGPANAYQVGLSDTLPVGAAFVSATPSQGLCAESSGTVTCDLRGLAPAASATVVVVVNPTSLGTATATATATTSSTDPNSANNAATATTVVGPATGAWVSAPALGLGIRSGHTATVLGDGRLLVAGGVDAGGITATAEVFNPTTGTWSTTGSLATARRKHTATLLADGRVLVAGGVSAAAVLASAEVWSPATGTWSATGSLAAARSNHSAARLDTDKVLVVGGFDVTTCPATVPNSAEIYDPAGNGGAGTWSATGGLAVNRQVGHTITKLSNGKVLAVGGYKGTNYANACLTANQPIAPVELFNPTAGTWSLAADTATRRQNHSATLLSDGSVLVAGGNPCNGNCPTTSVERYDPATDTWSPRAPLPLARFAHSATRLDNGKVLVAGGQGTPDATAVSPYVRATSVYDPATDTWASAGVMATGRIGPVVALSSNRVRVVGGQSGAGSLASVELWTPRPVVTSVSPTSGSGSAAVTVTITGTGLATVTSASFGTARTAAVTPDATNPDTTLTVAGPGTLNPAGGTVDVTVSSPGGTSATSAADQFSFGAWGYLRVTTPAGGLAAQISLDGNFMDTFGTTWVHVGTGNHTLCFSDVEGWETPPCQSVSVTTGATTTVAAGFVQRGNLQVAISPAGTDGTIVVDGTPRDNYGMFTDLPTGSHTVCFENAPDYLAPACQTVSVNAGATTTVTGTYTFSPGTVPPAGKGFLRVTTNPALNSQISFGFNGGPQVPRDTFGTTWVRVDPGTYNVCFRSVIGWNAVPCQSVSVTAGVTTSVQGNFTRQGNLQVVINPAGQDAVVSVDGIARNNYGMFTQVPTGAHTVCFGIGPTHSPPACQTVSVAALPAPTTVVTGTYTPS